MEKGLQAALRRFPLKGQEIRRLVLADGAFRALCNDLADAEAALGLWSLSTSANSHLRLAEYEALTKELAVEVEHMLSALSSSQRASS